MIDNNTPLVTVLVNTYNHVETIRDTLDGILMQQTTFPFDCLVIDDASTDGTTDIVMEYAEHNPTIIRACINQENIYHMVDGHDRFVKIENENIFGKYVALCEGDDYWTDDKKLQIQILYMETHPEVSFTTHASIIHDCTKGVDNDFVLYPNDCDIPMMDFFTLHKGAPHTASLVFRKEIYLACRSDGNFPRCGIGDFPLMMYALTKGTCHYFDRKMCIYRYNRPSAWTGQTRGVAYINFIIEYLLFWTGFDVYTNHKYLDGVRIFSNQQLISFADRMVSEKISEAEFIRALEKALKKDIQKIAYINAMRIAYERIRGKNALTEEENVFLHRVKHIVLFGTGKYSVVVKKMLEMNGLTCEGYMVSQKTDLESNVAPLWDFESYPYESGETALIIGVSYSWKYEIEPIIVKKGYMYIAPLWRDLCEWLPR